MKVLAYVNRHDFIVERARGKKVLDLGVIGATCLDETLRLDSLPRSLHWRINEVARETVGLDYAADVVQAAQEKYPNLNLIAADVEQLNLDDRFELVVMGDLIEHLSNPGLALSRIREVLDGQLVLSCPNALGAPNYLRFLMGRFHEGDDHVASHNKWTVDHLLGRHGYRIVELYTCLDRVPDRRAKRAAYKAIGQVLRRLPELGGTLLVVAEPMRA